MKKIKLLLENGDEYLGDSIGHEIQHDIYFGEIVFNTSMTGYQEIISDPSYCDQIITMTYPLIGNYGVSKDDFESLAPSLKGLVLRECPQNISHWRSESTLQELLKRFRIPAISGVDTREITKKIRSWGVMKAALVTLESKITKDDLEKFNLRTDQIFRVSTKSPIHFPGDGPRIIMIDFGHKKNILRSLMKRGCDVVVVPWDANFELIKSFNPRAIVLSNGPGDPKSIPQVLPVIRQLQNLYPMLSICMGHQLFALANGANTSKLKFGHRGGNHPVKDLSLGKVFMTSQNHGYTVDVDSITQSELEITQINLNDKTIEGLKHKSLPSFSVQYHPEASPGPEDTSWLFDEFLSNIKDSNAYSY